jgi:hypothetical protein
MSFPEFRGQTRGRATMYGQGTKNREIPMNLIAGAGTKTETNFLKGLKVPDSDRGVETVIFG